MVDPAKGLLHNDGVNIVWYHDLRQISVIGGAVTLRRVIMAKMPEFAEGLKIEPDRTRRQVREDRSSGIYPHIDDVGVGPLATQTIIPVATAVRVPVTVKVIEVRIPVPD